MKTIILIGILVLLLFGCSNNITRTQCLPETLEYTDVEMNDFGNKVIGDMEVIMPQYEWSYNVNKNCVIVIGR